MTLGTTLAPAVIIHGLADARAALALRRPLTLLSAPGAASYAGCGWWRAVVSAATVEHPGAAPPDVLDCAGAPGRALEALGMGCRLLVLHPCPAWAGIAARADAQGSTLLDRPPVALDLGQPGALRRLTAWLSAPP